MRIVALTAAIFLGGASSVLAQDALTASTVKDICFPELMDQMAREPDLLMVSSAAYAIDYNQNIDADLSVADVLYKRTLNGPYHLEIGGDREFGFLCVLTLPATISYAVAVETVESLMTARQEDWSRAPRMPDAIQWTEWMRADRVGGVPWERRITVETLPGGGPVRITVARRLDPFGS